MPSSSQFHTDPILRSQHIHRHNGAVRLIHKALRKGYLGSKLIMSDGGRDPSSDIRPTRTIPPWLLPPQSPPLSPIPNNPDLVMLWKDNMIPVWNRTLSREQGEEYRQMVYKKPKTNSEKKLKILEVCYTSLANITRKEQEKRDKYAPLLQRLIDKGYRPELHVIALGTSGEVTTSTSKTLGQFGMKEAPLDTLISELHENAIHWLEVCIDTELALNRAATSG